MRSYKTFILFMLFCFKLNAGGMPVIDTNELTRQISDALYFFSSVEGLLKEAGVTIDEQAWRGLHEELTLYQEQINAIDQLGYAFKDASIYRARSNVLVDQINSVTRHLAKINRAIMLAKSLGARPGSLKATMEVLKEERRKERERFEIALKSLEEREKISKVRRKLERELKLKRAIDKEYEAITKFSNGKVFTPLIYNNKKTHRKKESLW